MGVQRLSLAIIAPARGGEQGQGYTSLDVLYSVCHITQYMTRSIVSNATEQNRTVTKW